MRKSGLTGDEAYILSKHGKTTEDLGPLKKEISLIKEDLKSKADKTALAKTNRKLDALWKLNQGISYKFEKDDKEAYQKAIPTGAKLGSVKSVAGKTIVWNWLSSVAVKTDSINGIDYVSDGKNISLSGSATSYTEIMISKIALLVPILKGHKYYISTGLTENMLEFSVAVGGTNISVETRTKEIKTCETGNTKLRFLLSIKQGATFNNTVITPKLVDLTKMFGAGNEPSTPEEFEAMFPADYYEYNEGELMSAPVEEVINQGRNLANPDNFTLVACDYKNGIFYAKDGDSRDTFRLKFQQYIGSKYKESSQAFITPVVGRNTYSFTVLSDVTRVRISNDGVNREFSIFIPVSSDLEGKEVTLSIDCIDLTVGAFKSKDIQLEFGNIATPYVPYRCEVHQIPQKILDLLGYGWSAGDVCNEVDWENKQYIQRVGKYTIDGSEIIFKENRYWVMTVTDFEKPRPSTKNAICVNFKVADVYSEKWGGIIFRQGSNGFVFTDSESKFANANEVKDYFQQNNETIYYELNEEQIIDISDIIDNTFQEPFEVEAGGTLTFKNSHGDDYRIPVPSTEEYVIALAEVAK